MLQGLSPERGSVGPGTSSWSLSLLIRIQENLVVWTKYSKNGKAWNVFFSRDKDHETLALSYGVSWGEIGKRVTIKF